MKNQLDLLQPKTVQAISKCKQLSSPSATKRSPLQTLSVGCTYPHSFPGLDAEFCPDCEKSITVETTEYNELIKKRKQS